MSKQWVTKTWYADFLISTYDRRQVPDRRSICINPRPKEVISCSVLAQTSLRITCNNKYCHASLDEPSTSVIDSLLMSPHCFLFAYWEAQLDSPSFFLLLHAEKTNPWWYRRNLGEQERGRDTCFRIFWIIQENTLNFHLSLRYLWGLAEL